MRRTTRRLLTCGVVIGSVWGAPCAPLQSAHAAPADAGPLPDGEEPDGGGRPGQMAGLVDDAFRNLARTRNREGLAALQRDDLPAALAAFKEARELEPEGSRGLACDHSRESC